MATWTGSKHSERPTLSEIALGMFPRPLSRDELIRAAGRRGVPIKEGRIERRYIGELWFGRDDADSA